MTGRDVGGSLTCVYQWLVLHSQPRVPHSLNTTTLDPLLAIRGEGERRWVLFNGSGGRCGFGASENCKRSFDFDMSSSRDDGVWGK